MSDSRLVDQESRRLIRDELTTNLLVEAGAGSGKTQMLAERMAAGIAAGVYQIEHMAAVTFTRKAAAELRGRFHLALEKELRLRRGGSLEAGRVGDALSNLERFFAGTIHSFCARLLRERPVEAGVSPGFTELDEVQDLELRQRSWRDFISSARSAGDPDVMALLQAEVRPGDLDSAFATICLNDDVEFPPGEGVCPDPKAAWPALETFWNALQPHLPATIDPGTTCALQKAALTCRGQMRVSRLRLDRPAVMAALLQTWNCESAITQKWWASTPAEKKRFKELIATLHGEFRAAVVQPYLAQWRQYVYRLAVTLLTRARDVAAAERRRLNSLNYGDLLNLSARVLGENLQVRRALQQKYRHLFVDEFQDTDPVQAEIVFLLAAEGSSQATDGDWRELRLRPGALFVVGDPKQSIYRFRRADIGIYNIVRARFSDPASGRVLPLTMNFRSGSPLCDWANRVFTTRFPAVPTAQSPRFAALDAEKKDGTGGVFTLTHTCKSGDMLEEDAEKIATYIRSEVDAGRRRFSDFLILTRRKRGRIVPYAQALEALNIPIEVSGAGAFGESTQVATLALLLRALADPDDPLSLVAVLRGPLFGISDPELFAFRQAGGWFSLFYAADAEPGPDDDDVSRPAQMCLAALATLGRYYRWTRLLPAAAAVERILDHSGYLALAATTSGGVEAGDLLHAIDRIRQVVEEGGSVADAADSLGEDCDELNEVESLPLEPGRADVVRVMNLHKAKGLEAAVVFLADPNGGFAGRVDVHIERQELKAHGWFKLVHKRKGSHVPTLIGEHQDWAEHEATERPYLLAEEDRLLYVAATRAREQLIVSRGAGSPGQKAWGVLNDFLALATELPIPQAVAPPRLEPLDCSPAIEARAAVLRSEAHERLRPLSWSTSAVTADARHIARITRSADASPDDPTRVVGTDTPAHRADAGMAWGSLVHGLLEHAMRHRAATRDDLRRLAMWLTVDEPQLRPVIDEAIDTVDRAARADFWRLAQGHEHSVETPFYVVEPGDRLINGVIDLLFETDQGWQVVDYKTDVAIDAGAYAPQLEAYRAALTRIGCQVAGASVVSVRSKS